MRLVLAFVVCMTVPAMAADWVSFRDPDGSFAVDMPAQPKIDNGEGLKEYMVSQPTITYAVVVKTLPANLDPATFLQNAADAVRQQASQVFSERPVTLDGHAGYAMVVLQKGNVQVTDHFF